MAKEFYTREDKFKDAIQRRDTDKVSSYLGGADYDRGQIETLEATCDKLRRFCAALTIVLAEKEIVTPEEAARMVLP